MTKSRHVRHKMAGQKDLAKKQRRTRSIMQAHRVWDEANRQAANASTPGEAERIYDAAEQAVKRQYSEAQRAKRKKGK